MRRFQICLLTTLCIAIIASFVAAVDHVDPGAALSPRMLEIQHVLDGEAVDLAALQRELQAAPDEKEALRILRAIAQRKQDAEVAVLRIQKRYALQEGDTETVALIDEAIARILDPQPAPPSEEALREKEALRAELERRNQAADHD
jgi:hypothetical protein